MVEQIAGLDAESQVVATAARAATKYPAHTASRSAEAAKASALTASATSAASTAAATITCVRGFESLAEANGLAHAKVYGHVCWSLA